jgi:hypothetical protein
MPEHAKPHPPRASAAPMVAVQPPVEPAEPHAEKGPAPTEIADPPTVPIVRREPAALARPPADVEALLASVTRGDDQARHSIDMLLSLEADVVEMVVARMPGPLRLDRHALRGRTPPLADHGPLLQLLSRFGQRALDPLLRRIEDASLEVRYYATLGLGELGGPQAVRAIGSRLFDSDAGVRRVAIEALALQAESSAKQALLESLRAELPGPDVLRQRLTAEALGGLHDVASVPRLIELVKHADQALVASARRALIVITKQDFGTSRWRWRGWWDRHRDEPRVEWMLEGLGHSEPEVRMSAAEELRHLSTEFFGYQFDLPKREREDARRKWVHWWRTYGVRQQPPEKR